MDAILRADPKRIPFTLLEKEYLVDLVEENKDILDPVIRYNDSMTVYKRKQAWIVIGERYNDKFKENMRDVDQLKRMWSKIKIQIKKYMTVPRTESNIWNLARTMFRQYSRNGQDDTVTKDTESTLNKVSVRDAGSIRTESEANASQQENSTPNANVSSDDDLIILNVVAENSSGVTADQEDVIEVLNNEQVTNGYLPVTYSAGNESKNASSNQQPEHAPIPVQIDRTQTQFINNYQNMIVSNGLSQPISNTDHVTFAYRGEPSNLQENTADYSLGLWSDIHIDDNAATPDASSSGISVGRSKPFRRRQHESGTDRHLVKVMKRQDFYRNRSNKRNFTHRPVRSNRRSNQRDGDEEREVDDRSRDENFLSESSYRRRMLALAEEEHAQKMRLLKLKCDVLELQKQELASKLHCNSV